MMQLLSAPSVGEREERARGCALTTHRDDMCTQCKSWREFLCLMYVCLSACALVPEKLDLYT